MNRENEFGRVTPFLLVPFGWNLKLIQRMNRIEEESQSLSFWLNNESKSSSQGFGKENQEQGLYKERHSDRFIPFRSDEESRNFYELSCSLGSEEENSTAANSQSIEKEEERANQYYSSFLAKKMFNFRLNCPPANVIDHEAQPILPSESRSSSFYLSSSPLLEIPSGPKQPKSKGRRGLHRLRGVF